MLKAIPVEEILSAQGVIIDVRSESEFAEAHVPGAIGISLFSDGERAEVGTLYKKSGPESARVRGLEIVKPKLSTFWIAFEGLFKELKLNQPGDEILKQAFAIVADRLMHETPTDDVASLIVQNPKVHERELIFYCWRGGARSRSMAMLAQLLGFNSRVVTGGHKAFRAYVQNYLDAPEYPFKICTLYGLTGAAKTQILQQWQVEGKPIIDLEALAFHRGSAFGQLGFAERGRQKDFENNLFWQMQKLAARGEKFIVVEGESQRIGYCQLPNRFMEAMLDGIHVKVDRSLEERVEHIIDHYVKPFKEEAVMQEAVRALDAIKRKLGSEKHKELALILAQKNYSDFTRELLVNYYDKLYGLSRAPDDFYHLVINGASDWEKIAVLLNG
ncbi:MAG: tRNA 2-selenouridine(34) synthase MnmH [Oligoflexia bacterium]|nr:tRNA 2-selenouridine(34) synthase MnmH [Oligoflexia bacterium]